MRGRVTHSGGTSIGRRGFVAIVIVTLAIGIGAAVAIFTVVNAVLLRDLPYPNPDRLLALRTVAPDGSATGAIAPRDMAPLYADHPLVQAASIAFYTQGRIVGADGTAYNMGRYGVGDQFFEVLDVPMALGRGFERGEPAPPAVPSSVGSVVLAYATWRDLFDSDPQILGKSITIENGVRPVVGVAPEGFRFPGNAGYWTLMQLSDAYANLRGYQAYLRLRPGATREQLDAQLTTFGAGLAPDPNSNVPIRFATVPLLRHVVGSLGPTVLLLFGSTAILLLIACINVANLLLARGTARGRELALRAAVGAQRTDLFRILLTESVRLSLAGGVLGVAVGLAAIKVMLRLAPGDLPRLDSVPLDSRVFLFAVGVSLLTGALAGLAPAWRLSHSDLRTLINDGGRGAGGDRYRQRIFGGLVVAEIGLAVVLVIGAGLLIRSYHNLVTTDPGIRTERLLSVFVNVPFDSIQVTFPRATPSGNDAQELDGSYRLIADYFRELEDRVRALKGVAGVTVTSSVPLASRQWDTAVAFTIEGEEAADPSIAQSQAMLRGVSAAFFSSLGVRVLAGRALEPTDKRGTPGVAVVNETFVRRYFGGANPVGRRIAFPANLWRYGNVGFQNAERVVDSFEIVGVVADVRYVALGEAPEPSVYLPNEQFTSRRTNLVVRAATDNPAALIPAIRAEIAAVRSIPADFEVYSQTLRASLVRQRFGMSLLAAFGAVALVLAAVGVYGVASYSVAQRTGEMAVRSALGASPAHLLWLVVRQSARLGVLGIAIGVGVALALRKLIASQLYAVDTLDVGVFVTAPLVLLAIAFLASFAPAQRASKVDPALMLRGD